MKRIIFSLILTGALFGLNIKNAYLQSFNFEKMGNYKEAIKALIPVYKKYTNGYIINLRLGYLFYLDKKYINSIKHYKMALVVAPNSVEARLGLIKNYLAIKKYNNAIAIAQTIIKKDFYNYYGNYYLLLALKYNNELDEAIKVAKKMLALYPANILYLQELAELLYKKGKKKESKKIFQTILILDPNNIVAREYLNY